MKKMLRRLEEENIEVEELDEEVEQEDELFERDFMQMVIDEVNHKTLSIVGTFDTKMVSYVKTFVDNLWYYEDDDKRPLFVDISSHGGFASDLMAILDLLDKAKKMWDCKIITRCVGYAESCGFILWCFGDEREMGEYSSLMCHKISYGMNGSLDDHESEFKRSKKVQEKIDKIIMKKTNITKKMLNKWYASGDKFIDYDEALELGLIEPEEEEENEDNKEE